MFDLKVLVPWAKSAAKSISAFSKDVPQIQMSQTSVIILIGPAVLAAKSEASTFHGRPDLFPYPLIFVFLTF